MPKLGLRRAEPARSGGKPLLLRRNRDFRLLWIGESISEIGSSVTYLALPFVALVVLHASTFQVAALTAVGTIGWPLVALPAGVWVDRLSRRRVLIVTDVGRALALASIPIAAAVGALTLGQLYAVAAVAGVLGIFFAIAYPSYLPSLVDQRDLVEGNALLSGTESFAQVTGPAFGGLLVQAVGAAYAMIADAVSFAVSATALLAIRCPEPPVVPVRRAMRHEVAEGVHFLVQHKVLRSFVLAAATSNLFAGGAQAISVLFLVRVVHVRAGIVGVLLGISSLGGVGGALVARRTVARLGDARTMVAASTLEALGAYLVPATSRGLGLSLFCLGSGLGSLSIVVFNVVGGSYRQQVVPARLMGRVLAANRMVTWGALPLGAFGAGWLAVTLGIRSALWVLAGGLALAPLWLVVSGLFTMRDLPRGIVEPVPVAST
jgi:Na+/melibiose symporter-like transporter